MAHPYSFDFLVHLLMCMINRYSGRTRTTSVNNEASYFEFCFYSFWQGLQILNKKWNPSCIVVVVKAKEQIHKLFKVDLTLSICPNEYKYTSLILQN